jgi:conjugative relaxase-like TrwC/TraI family protein
MLSMAPIHSIEYYLNLAKEDYYLNGGEPPGRWAGLGARILGLRGLIEPQLYRQLMHGYSPSGQALCDNAGAEGRRVGWDLTFSPPKSVSVLWARAEATLQGRLQAAQHTAVQAALQHLEAHAAITRRGHNGIEREAVDGFVAATFEHSTSREMDPQLHTHCLIMNLAPRGDGSWGSIESRDLYLWRHATGAVYRAALATQLRALGFTLAVNNEGQTFEVAGVPQAICKHFSKRAQGIVAELEARGLRSSASASGDIIKFATREHKIAVDRPALCAQWRAEMDARGFTREHLAALQQPDRAPSPLDPFAAFDAPAVPVLDAQALLEQLIEKKAVFKEQDAYRLAAEWALASGDSAATAERVARQAIDHADALNLGRDYRHSRLFTTRSQLAAEQQLVADAKALRVQSGFELPVTTLEQALQSQAIKLSTEQTEAVLEVCQGHRFAILQGSAGAGKSTSMACVRSAYEQEGFRVIGAAVAKAAADNLAREAGMPTFTIAKLLSDIERGRYQLTNRTVLVIDEAGQLGTTQLAALTTAAKQASCKIILTGEDKQLDAIKHGGILRYLSRPEILGTSRIQTIRRQHEQWARQAVADLRDGNALEALQAHQQRGQLHFAENQEAALNALVERWQQCRDADPSKQLLVLAQQWRDVKELSERIRDIYRAEGIVAPTGVTLNCIVGEHKFKQEFALGDRVRFTRNDYAKGFTNGTLGALTGMTQRGNDWFFEVQADDGRTLRFTQQNYSDEGGRLHLVHAYASTIYASQGLTVDEAFILHDIQMDRASAYVAGSRHRDQCQWFCNSKALDELNPATNDDERLQHLAKSLSTDRYHALALEVWERLPKAPEPAREQQHDLELV